MGAKGWGTRLIATYPENIMFISQLEVFGEGEVKKWGTWRMLRVSDLRHG